MKKLAICMMILTAAQAAWAGSTLLQTPAASDLALAGGGPVGKVAVLTGPAGDVTGLLNFYDVLDATWTLSGHVVDLHDADGDYVRTIAQDSIAAGWVAWVAQRDGTVYLGRTSSSIDAANHRIDAVSLAGTATPIGAATLAANLMYSYDMAFDSAGNAFATYNPGGFNPQTKIARIDLAGGNAHQIVADLGGYAAELAFDADDNLVFGTNGLAQDSVLRYSAAQLVAGGLTAADAAVLAQTPLSVDGLAVDAGGNVIFSMNDYSGWPYVGAMGLIETGKDYSGAASDYDLMCASAGSVGNILAVGDVTLFDGATMDNCAFGVGFGGPVSFVPEPATLVLLGGGALALLRRRRRD